MYWKMCAAIQMVGRSVVVVTLWPFYCPAALTGSAFTCIRESFY